ncbi:MAG: 2-C-methyl-D-erythritol 2,4-cyclodiphosphate synthase [Verrucomicrobia bacterium]|nr:2-C-methyl-D-erythritol 2,4-cyclodiphosphate synthase [Verrucomicrobiota bacterium]MDA1086088.1 2-C-methyl-D-erythritol 2,4-cyclodiphosphate synthase [Verrucomicrobiota bacterium]
MRTGFGVDAHRFADDRLLILGGVHVDHPRGLEGHSDADVVAHVVMDALLGAIADGDIGTHFPDTDVKWKDADSLELLAIVRDRLRSRGVLQINNIDITIMAERPRIGPHVSAMRQKLAGALAIAVDRVSVKATTVERMGAIGREEGIAAMAVATVETK